MTAWAARSVLLAALGGAPLAAAAETPAADPADDDAVDGTAPTPAEVRAARRLARREARIAERKATWNARVLPPEMDFLRTHRDVRIRLGFNGTSASPLSILTALAGWNELGLQVDVGVANYRDFTVSIGGTVSAATSAVLGATLANIANYEDVRFGWSMFETAAVVRVAFHFTQLSSMDPYVFGGVGGGAFSITSSVRDVGGDAWAEVPEQTHTSGTIRGEAGGGLNLRIKGNWTVGVELRYLLSFQVDPRDRFLFERDGELAVFQFATEHQPPRGFSWVLGVGYRF